MAVTAAQRLAAATAWFPPAALAFDLTAAVAFAGAVTAQAILAVRSKKEMNYIASMSATIGASSALQPLNAYSAVVYNLTGSMNNVGVMPAFGRAILQASQIYLLKTTPRKTFTITLVYLSEFQKLKPEMKTRVAKLLLSIKKYHGDKSKLAKIMTKKHKMLWRQRRLSGHSSAAASPVFNDYLDYPRFQKMERGSHVGQQRRNVRRDRDARFERKRYNPRRQCRGGEWLHQTWWESSSKI